MDDDMPFLCPIPKCGKRFTNEDHLNVHSKTHEMSLALNTEKTINSPAHPFVDQTPTPTKILKNFEEIGLFQELSKNPFDDAYKKALDSEVVPLPGPQTNELNTPTLIMTDTTRHVSTSSSTGLSVLPSALDKLKTADKLKPSPLAKETRGSKSNNSLGKGDKMSMSTSALTITRSNRSELTSQDADSTSNDLIIDHSNRNELQEHLDDDFSSATQSVSSPHSTTISTTTIKVMKPNSLAADRAKEMKADVKAESAEDTAAAAAAAAQQQCTMQVLLQLPNGQTVPISIPATINNVHMVDEKPILQQQQQDDVMPHVPQILQQIQPQQPQQQLTQAPTLQPALSKVLLSTPPGGNSSATTMALKQRLKAQLQNQLSPTAKSSEQTLVSQSAFVPAVANTNSTPSMSQVFITHPSSPSLMMMIDSPGSEVNMSDSSEYSFDSKRQKMSPDCEDPEERRRKFLERNRAAAARCRQKRKHWIGNLERKADDLQNTNLRLQNDVKMLRGEVAHLKTLLLAHKDCPVTQQQKSTGQLQQVMLAESLAASSHQELAQVVPTGDHHLPGGTTIMAFVSNSQTVTDHRDPKQD